MVKPGSWRSIKPGSWRPASGKPWLSITPEPERELPEAIATLAHAGSPPAEAVAAERDRIEGLIVRGSERAWLAYLHGVVELIHDRSQDADPEVSRARARAAAVISNHHNLLLGLPGRGARLSAGDRTRLAQLSTGNSRPRGRT